MNDRSKLKRLLGVRRLGGALVLRQTKSIEIDTKAVPRHRTPKIKETK